MSCLRRVTSINSLDKVELTLGLINSMNIFFNKLSFFTTLVHILSKANCPSYRGKQNMMASQFQEDIYYSFIMEILQDTEIFMSNGEDYEAELGIDPFTANTYKGKKDHTNVAVPCYKFNILTFPQIYCSLISIQCLGLNRCALG